MKNLLLVIGMLSITNLSFAQKIDKALEQFMETAFMKEMQKFRDGLETTAKKVKEASEEELSKAEVAEIKKGYDKCVEKYNGILLEIKSDLLNGKMLKFIVQSPEKYGKIIKSDLHDLQKVANYEFHGKIMETSMGATYGSVTVVAIIIEIIGLIREAIVWLKNLKKTTEAVVDKVLIKGFQLKTWDQL
ncbi:MAG: hypothetical protein GY810_02930 [Aureispira sp.]|nr:hypothetical protein [Aureispira sp.]